MGKTGFSNAFVEKLNAEHSGGVFLRALEVTETTSPLVIRRFVDHPQSITFNGNAYTPLPMLWSDFEVTSQMSLQTMTVTLSDANDEVADWAETFSVVENDVAIQILHLDLLDDIQAEDSHAFKILAIDSEEATRMIRFTLGQPTGLGDVLPRGVITKQEFPGIPDSNRPILV